MIIYKVLDPRQYKLSPGYKNIDIEEIIKNHKTKDVYDLNYFDFFASADAIETHIDFSKVANYIVPFFYNHAEQLETLDYWKQSIKQFIEDYRSIFEYSTLAICDPHESTQHFIDTFEELKQNYNIKIIAITANKKYINGVYTDSWIHRFPPIEPPIDFYNKKLYINLNRVARYHRCKLLDNLIDNNLHTLGYNTWGNVYSKFAEYKATNNTRIDTINWDVLDIQDLSSVNPNNNVPLTHCKDSFLYIATETNIDSKGLFFSEKSYKPIALGMPFIILGNPGTIDDLKKRGYKTFEDYWNEDYDLDLPLSERINIIISNLVILQKQDLNKLRSQIESILTHNLLLYTQERKTNKLRENLNALFNNS